MKNSFRNSLTSLNIIQYIFKGQLGLFFYRSTYVDSAWSFGFSSQPQRPMTSEGFLYQILSITIIFLILEKNQVFPFSMLIAKQGNYWYHLYNVFGMTSRTRSQYSTTRLSRRRYKMKNRFGIIYRLKICLEIPCCQVTFTLFRHRTSQHIPIYVGISKSSRLKLWVCSLLHGLFL